MFVLCFFNYKQQQQEKKLWKVATLWTSLHRDNYFLLNFFFVLVFRVCRLTSELNWTELAENIQQTIFDIILFFHWLTCLHREYQFIIIKFYCFFYLIFLLNYMKNLWKKKQIFVYLYKKMINWYNRNTTTRKFLFRLMQIDWKHSILF